MSIISSVLALLSVTVVSAASKAECDDYYAQFETSSHRNCQLSAEVLASTPPTNLGDTCSSDVSAFAAVTCCTQSCTEFKAAWDAWCSSCDESGGDNSGGGTTPAPAAPKCGEEYSMYQYKCTDGGISEEHHTCTDCSGEPSAAYDVAFGECKDLENGYSLKAVSCGDGEGVMHIFASNDCSGDMTTPGSSLNRYPTDKCLAPMEARGWGTQTPEAEPRDSFFDDQCGEGWCIAAIKGGHFTECVENKCCPYGSRTRLLDGECVENTCEMMLKYDWGATGEIVRPEVPACMKVRGCVSEIVEQDGMQCMSTKIGPPTISGGNYRDATTCKTGGWENQCLADNSVDNGGCTFNDMLGFKATGECSFDHLSEEGKAASGQLYGGALIAVIVAPIGVVLLLCICGLALGIYCCCKPGGCCNPKKKEDVVVAGVKTSGV